MTTTRQHININKRISGNAGGLTDKTISLLKHIKHILQQRDEGKFSDKTRRFFEHLRMRMYMARLNVPLTVDNQFEVYACNCLSTVLDAIISLVDDLDATKYMQLQMDHKMVWEEFSKFCEERNY